MTLLHALRRPVAALMLLTLGACHSLVPMEHVPGVNEEARIRLTDLGAASMAPVVGPGVTGLRGTIVAADSATVRLSVTAVTDREGLENRWLGEQVTVKREYITGYDKRELSPLRSALVTIGIGAGMYMLAATVSGGSDGFLRAIGVPKGK